MSASVASPIEESKDRRRQGFPFRSDALFLDFVATVAKRDMHDREMLDTTESFQTWLHVAGLPAAVESIVDDDLVTVRDLREALNRLTRARVDGGRPRSEDILLVNASAIAAPPHDLLSHDGRTAIRAAPAPVAGILSIIARDAIELFSGEHHDRVRRCLGHDCSLYFVDRSRRGNRRWCSMSACGEKASSAAYRRRNGATSRTDTP